MRIAGIAASLPSKRITNDWIIEQIVTKSTKHLSKLKLKLVETLLKQAFLKSGTHTRHVRDKGERALELTLKAGREALDKAGMQPNDIDLLIYTGVGRGWLEPAMANLFQYQLLELVQEHFHIKPPIA